MRIFFTTIPILQLLTTVLLCCAFYIVKKLRNNDSDTIIKSYRLELQNCNVIAQFSFSKFTANVENL